MDYHEVVALLQEYEKEARDVKRICFKLAWYMRGGITMEEMYNTSNHDRKIISELIEENMKTTKESGLPHF
jgi:thiamine kinase-like enzyme